MSTDNAYMLLNLLTLAESPDPGFKLELSATFYDPLEFSPYKHVYVDGQKCFSVSIDKIGAVGISRERLRRFAKDPLKKL